MSVLQYPYWHLFDTILILILAEGGGAFHLAVIMNFASDEEDEMDLASKQLLRDGHFCNELKCQ